LARRPVPPIYPTRITARFPVAAGTPTP
jgi:hypothetical protein